MKAILKIILAGLFIACLFKMPYGYYQFVRFIGMLGFIYLGTQDEIRPEVKYFWLASAVLINPIIKIPLGRELWNAVDIVWAALLLASMFLKVKK